MSARQRAVEHFIEAFTRCGQDMSYLEPEIAIWVISLVPSARNAPDDRLRADW
jgi:hypothetical protein